MELQDRFQGCLIGLAVGDAIGTTLEFKHRGSFEPITDMVGGGPFFLKPGQWTDDTSMAICLAESLIDRKGFDAADQMDRYLQWWKQGKNSSTGKCFDIGTTVANALHAYQSSKKPFCGDTDPMSAGNGSLMRLAPVILFYYTAPDYYHYIMDSSRTTHSAPECLDACCYLGSLIKQILSGTHRSELMRLDYTPKSKKVARIANLDFLKKTKDQIKGSGYVIECLEAALWCFYKTDNFNDAVLLAANLGDDADTTAAVCGQIAGAYYGLSGIRGDWYKKLYENERILSLAINLYQNKA
ncbi:MAG: ADP-ribosylglycohydrolase family protein [Neptuniibacter sp.]